MKNTVAIIYFNLGVNVLGFTKVWKHTVSTFTTNSRFFAPRTKIEVTQMEL